MKIKLAGLVFAAPLVIWASTPVPLLAHHSFAKFFDVNKPIHIEGVVRRVEWRQPHVEFVLDVRDRKNETTSWLFEINPIKILNKYGWDQDTVKPGMEILVDGFQARDPRTHRAVGSSITIKSTGKVLATPLGEDRLPYDDVAAPPALFELDENTGLVFLGFLVIGTGLIAVLLIRRTSTVRSRNSSGNAQRSLGENFLK